MAGVGFDVDREGRDPAAHPLGADAELVDPVEEPFLHVGVKGVGVVGAQRPAEQGFLASQAEYSKFPPTPTPTTIGGQGLEPPLSAVSTTKSSMPSRPAAGGNIRMALMFSAPPPLAMKATLKTSPGTSSQWM